MSFPEYKDFDKIARDLHSDGYDIEYSLKLNSQGPFGVSVSTSTEYGPGVSVFPTRLSTAWEHSSGFAINKLEIGSSHDVKLETSLKNVAPGLLLRFAGEKIGTGILGAVYSHKVATINADIDLTSCSAVSIAALGGSQGFTAGASAGFGFGGKFEVLDFSTALGYTPKDGVFAGVQAKAKLSEFNASVLYTVRPNVAVTALVDFVPKVVDAPVKVSLGTSALVAGCQVKVKASNDGLINASVQREFPKNLVINAAAAVNARDLRSYSFGVTATLG